MSVEVIPTPEPLNGIFKNLGVDAVTYGHIPVFTVEEGRGFKHMMPGGHTKNLFLRDKKEKQWLITALWDTKIDLKKLEPVLGATRLSFGSPDRLLRVLGVTPGSVTPLALVNDLERQVKMVLDAALFNYDLVNCHPLRNDMTTAMTPKDLQKTLESWGYDIDIVDFTVI